MVKTQLIGYALAVNPDCESGFLFRVAIGCGIVVLFMGFRVLRLLSSAVSIAAERWMARLRRHRLRANHDSGPPARQVSSDESGETSVSQITEYIGPMGTTTVDIDSSALKKKRRYSAATLVMLLGALVVVMVFPIAAAIVMLLPPLFPMVVYLVITFGGMVYTLLRPHHDLGDVDQPMSIVLWFLSLIVAGYGLLFAGLAGGDFVCPRQEQPSFVKWMAVCLALLVLASLLMRLGQRRATPRSSEALGGGSPILYLRSFQDDSVKITISALSPHTRKAFLLGPHRQRFEEFLVAQLSIFGPVVAVSQPGHHSQPIGASREELASTSWQNDIQQWLLASQFIVVGVGRTAGLQWELQQIAHLGLTSKLMFLFPPVSTLELRRRWRQLWNDKFDPVDSALTAVTDNSVLSVYVGRKRDEWGYAAAIEAAVRELDRAAVAPGLARERIRIARAYIRDSAPAGSRRKNKGYRQPNIKPPISTTGHPFLLVNGLVTGPYTTVDLRGMAQTRQVSPDTPVADQGRWLPLRNLPGIYSSRSWAVTLTLSICLGFLGADRFYLGKLLTGLIKALTLGGFGVWWVIDAVFVRYHMTTDAKGRPLQ
jgi:hypothetical protein